MEFSQSSKDRDFCAHVSFPLFLKAVLCCSRIGQNVFSIFFVCIIFMTQHDIRKTINKRLMAQISNEGNFLSHLEWEY